jgi:hypothetical protein
MSKRVNPSNDKPPAKRIRGFRLARTRSNLGPSTSSLSSSVFVTVNTGEQHSGTLKAQTWLLSRTFTPSLTPTPESASEPQNDDCLDSCGEVPVEPTPQADIPPKPKRKRYTTNVVCYNL